MFKHYTPFQWLLIDAANAMGHDKMLFEERIQWAMDHLPELEDIASEADSYPLYVKAVSAIRKAQRGIPTGHLVGVDGVCSGIQIMSCLTGCYAGAYNTGLINDNMRADAYGKTTEEMIDILAGLIAEELHVTRAEAKSALMTAFYGSKAEPVKIFGADTPQLEAFYEAAQRVAPGAWELLQDLLASWQPYALMHRWVLPDGFDVRVKVMTKIGADDSRSRVEVDELDHATFTYEYFVNEGTKKGKSNVANVTHSMDAWVLRSMHRRCNYDARVAAQAADAIAHELYMRSEGLGDDFITAEQYIIAKVNYYKEQYERSTIADIVILPYLDMFTVRMLSTEHLAKLGSIIAGMLQYKPFPIITIHDEFKSHANNVNWMRWQYKEILADIADSNVLVSILDAIHGAEGGEYQKKSYDLGDKIRQSNYALC
jgi:hypothetical protein